jgi:DNA-binding Lrp family transcriptional regulator
MNTMAETPDPEFRVDRIDREIMQRIVDNARIPAEDLADELNLSVEEVERRIAQLEDIGIIKAYRAVVDPYLYSLYFFENGPLGPKAQFRSKRH